MKFSFFIPMEHVPTVTDQEHKIAVINGRPQIYKPPELKDAKAMFLNVLAPHAPATPLRGAVEFVVKWCFPLQGHRDGDWKTTKPDTDNLQKLLKDCMTKTKYWTDDAQVASELSQKFHSKITGIWIMVRELEAIDEE